MSRINCVFLSFSDEQHLDDKKKQLESNSRRLLVSLILWVISIKNQFRFCYLENWQERKLFNLLENIGRSNSGSNRMFRLFWNIRGSKNAVRLRFIIRAERDGEKAITRFRLNVTINAIFYFNNRLVSAVRG